MNGSRLFGNMNGQYNNGYEKMAQLDANKDGQLAGAELNGLELWVDNSNARVDSGEMRSLADFGLTSIDVNKQDTLNDRGETLLQSSAQTADGRQMLTEDVFFADR